MKAKQKSLEFDVTLFRAGLRSEGSHRKARQLYEKLVDLSQIQQKLRKRGRRNVCALCAVSGSDSFDEFFCQLGGVGAEALAEPCLRRFVQEVDALAPEQ